MTHIDLETGFDELYFLHHQIAKLPNQNLRFENDLLMKTIFFIDKLFAAGFNLTSITENLRRVSLNDDPSMFCRNMEDLLRTIIIIMVTQDEDIYS